MFSCYVSNYSKISSENIVNYLVLIGILKSWRILEVTNICGSITMRCNFGAGNKQVKIGLFATLQTLEQYNSSCKEIYCFLGTMFVCDQRSPQSTRRSIQPPDNVSYILYLISTSEVATICFNIMGDKSFLILGRNFSVIFKISHLKLQNYLGNVWRKIPRYNKQVKNPGL